jgi:branched-chain amino acid transport system substrate-binding protein
MTRSRTWALLATLLLLVPLMVAACGGDDDGGGGGDEAAPAEETTAGDTATEEEATGEPLVIGAAVDLTNAMAPFDGPAIGAAQIQAEKVNGEGGVDGRQIQIEVVDTQLDPEQTKAAAIDLIDEQGAEILLVTCDVDFATPAVQEAISRGVLAVSMCIGTDQMSPKRFGEAGKLAFTIGNAAQDEGAAMAEYAIDQGWTRAAIAKDNVIIYFQNVVDAFKARFEERGGEIVAEESWTNGDGTIGNVAGSLASADVDVIATSTAFDDLPGLVDGIRSLGSDTPIICSWACDGTYWNPQGLSNFYLVTYASVAGDDPNQEVKDLIQAMTDADTPPGTGGFLAGAGTIDALAAAIEETGSTDGEALADALEGFQDVPTVSGEISFSPELHAVSGREYRVMQIQNGQLSFVELRAASSPASLE